MLASVRDRLMTIVKSTELCALTFWAVATSPCFNDIM
jgi:hypothetical protein